jgi:hypothetical protein
MRIIRLERAREKEWDHFAQSIQSMELAIRVPQLALAKYFIQKAYM